MDSNFQYAGAVNLVCCPRCRGLLRTTPASPERRQGFAPDWPPEGDGFEPSVPQRRTIKSITGVVSALIALAAVILAGIKH